jgi:aryl-alcohol dehydrogenase-like predicted oxidoreductase
VEASLRRLQTDCIDLYQIHRWDPQVPPAETLRALDDLVTQGKVRYVGCSNLTAHQIDLFMNLAERHHWSPFISLQPVYNALNRGIEVEILPATQHWGLGVITYNPLAGGMLTGKYRPGQEMPAGARLQAFQMYYERYYTQTAMDSVEAFLAAARERAVTPAQLALAWVLGEPRVTCPIVGARNVAQLDDTLGGLALHLTADERDAVPSVLPGRWVGKDPVYDRG